MGGILGVFQRDNGPIAPDRLELMREAMASWGPDGSALWQQGPVGLGSLRLYNTPESLAEQLPRAAQGGRLVITAEARLDNREALFQSLRIPFDERRRMVDSDLILLAYERWGEECPSRLIGDWSFAIWEPEAQKLFLAVDHLGSTGLYYHLGPRSFAFASSIKALLVLPEMPRRLDELRLAEILALCPDPEPRTIYEEILPLQTGHCLTLTPEKVHLRRYWDPQETPELHLKSRQEYLEGFMEVYTEAINCRLRSHRPVATMLSGGLDSGSAAVIAARQLGLNWLRLSAFSSVPLHDVSDVTSPNFFSDETTFVQSTARHAGNIDVQWITAQDISPLEAMRRTVELHDTPLPNAGNFFWIVDLLEKAQGQGIGAVLFAQGGNNTVSWHGMSGPGLHYLMQQKRWKTILRRLAVAGMPESLRRLLAKRGAISPVDLTSTAISPAFAQRFDMVGRYAEVLQGRAWDAKGIRCAALDIHRMGGGALQAELGAGYSLELRDPTYDPRVVAYCLSIPDWVYTGPQGESRWLMRAAMTELLPEDVRNNQKYGRQAADLEQRLRSSAGEVNEVLNLMERSPLAREYLALDRIAQVWEEVQQEISAKTTRRALAILSRGIQAGLFLMREEAL